MTTEASTWSVSIYLIIYSSFWRGLTALSILCGLGNARACDSRMGREQHLRLFCILRRTIKNKELLTFGVLIGYDNGLFNYEM